MNQLKIYGIVFGAGLLLAALLAGTYGLGRDAGLRYAAQHQAPPDTVTIIKPVKDNNPQISAVKPLKVVYLPFPVVAESGENQAGNSADSAGVVTVAPGDSIATVAVPIEQAYYSGEDYEAWVSGFRPRLDSIFVNRKTVTVYVPGPAPEPSRFSFGITAGPGVFWNGGKIEPGLGVVAGLQFRF